MHQFLSPIQCQYTLTLSALTYFASTALPTCQYCIRHVTYYNPMLFEHCVNVSCPRGIHNSTQLTQGDVKSMLVQRLSTIYDVGPTVDQRTPTLIQRLVSAGLPIHMYIAVSSSPRPSMDVFALPEKSNMAVTESNPDPKVRKMSILFNDCAISELSIRAWN